MFLAAAIGGARIGIATAIAGGALGVIVNFGSGVADSARFALLVMFWAVCGFAIWGVEHYRTIVVQQREDAKRLIREEEY
ncbi:MAG: sensor histidine kinase, partial [Bradyrhizobium sp.]|nr:sensor histidine kinase [Bradyrhizobium sp.]